MSSVTELNQRRVAGQAVSPTAVSRSKSIRSYLDDAILLGVMPLIAGCGLVYEYALSHYAGVVIGNTETAIFIMIGIMIMSAGFGSLLSQQVRNPFIGMAWLELGMIVLGSAAVPLIAGTIYLSKQFFTFTIVLKNATVGVEVMVPYLVGFLMGFLMGMEMPLVARVREQIRGSEGARGTAIVYAIDCIGIAAGTFAWAAYLGDIDVTKAATLAASVNAVALTVFILRYRARIVFHRGFVFAISVAASALGLISVWGPQLSEAFPGMVGG